MLSPADGGTVSLESIAVLDNLERIANNGVWFDGQGDRKGRAQIAGFDHLKTTVYIDGAPYLVDMRVRLVETTPGQGVDNVLYYYTPEEIITVERVGTVSPTGERRALTITSETMPTLNQSIPQTAPGVNPAEGASTPPGRLSDLLQKVKAEAREGLKKPYGVSEETWAKLKSSLADPILADKMRKALGDYLGYSSEFQTTIAPLLDRTLAAMEDIVLWEGLDRSSQTWQDLQPLYQERKETVQWLENILQKMEALNGEQIRQVKVPRKEKLIEESPKLTEPETGSTIGEQKGKKITAITDGAINKVQKVRIPYYTEEQCETIQRYHKELLEHARAENQGKEVAFVFRPDMTDKQVFLGSEDTLDFGSSLYGTDLIVMHNHPRNSSFSYRDISFMLNCEGVKCLTIVKNNGGVELLIKTDAYDRGKAEMELRRCRKRYIRTGSDAEITRAIYEFLKTGKGGFEWITVDGC